MGWMDGEEEEEGASAAPPPTMPGCIGNPLSDPIRTGDENENPVWGTVIECKNEYSSLPQEMSSLPIGDRCLVEHCICYLLPPREVCLACHMRMVSLN